jgi:hypothetical protein
MIPEKSSTGILNSQFSPEVAESEFHVKGDFVGISGRKLSLSYILS